MKKEKSIIVKLPPEVKIDLEQQAKANGRAMMREAASLIKDGLKKGAQK